MRTAQINKAIQLYGNLHFAQKQVERTLEKLNRAVGGFTAEEAREYYRRTREQDQKHDQANEAKAAKAAA